MFARVVPCVCLVATLCAAIGDAQSGTGAQAPSDEAAALWARALTAKGGADTLRATRSVLVRWHSGRFCAVDLHVPPAHKWSWQDGRAYDLGLLVEHINLDDARHTNQTRVSGRGEHMVGRIRPQHRNEVSDVLVATFLETASLRPTPIAVEPRGKDTLLSAEWEGGQIDYLLDAQARPKEVIFHREAAEPFEIRWVLRDYRLVGGLDLPHRIDEGIGGRGTGSRRLTYEINPRYDPRTLWVPPSLAAGPNGWRRPMPPPPDDDLRLYEKTVPKGCGTER